MDANVVSALITGGVGALGIVGAVVTSAVSSRNSRAASERAVEAGSSDVRATLAAARDDRLWERRAAAYEEALTGLLHRQAKRHFDLREHHVTTEQQMKDFYEGYQLPGVFETESRLTAYASNPVLAAHKATRGAHAAVQVAYSHRAALRESNKLAAQTGRIEGNARPEDMTDAQRKLDTAIQAADTADNTLIELIRSELRSRPEAAMAPTAEAVTRNWRRHRRAVEG